MPLSKREGDFRLEQISYLDFKQTEMDRVLTVSVVTLLDGDSITLFDGIGASG